MEPERFRLLVGDAAEMMDRLPGESVNMIATSPPYFGHRDYDHPQQIGREPSVGGYVENLVRVFGSAWRVLRFDGVLFLNLGDGYSDKQLQGVPWRVALALQQYGWLLRASFIWAKPDPMPDSALDRPIRSYEYVFMLAKERRYFYDWFSLREPAVDGGLRNGRDVWTVRAENVPDAHHAVYPRDLVRRMIQAGSSDHGRCAICGAPYDRIVLRDKAWRDVAAERAESASKTGRRDGHVAGPKGVVDHVRHGGWMPRCAHLPAEPEPCVVLDPFLGSGQTAIQALRMGRACWGIELNPSYAALAGSRIAPLLAQGVLF